MANSYVDCDIYGRELSDGSGVEHKDSEAIKNALILYLTSRKGDFLKRPELGGPLDRVIFKSLNGNIIPLVKFTIKNAILKYFSPSIKLRSIEFSPDYSNKIAEIKILYSDNLTEGITQAQIYTRDILGLAQQENQTVSYTGENLRMFCLMQKPSMGTELLLYNEDNDEWRWGRFLFSAFSTEDEQYENILSICNS